LYATGGKIERVCIKFCVKLSKSPTKTLEMISEVFGEHSLSRTVVFEWHSRVKAGRVSVEVDERSVRPSKNKKTENIEKIQEFVHEDHRRTIHELTHTVGISYGVCHEIFAENWNMRRIAVKFVPDPQQMIKTSSA
jgi:hypothetical protein